MAQAGDLVEYYTSTSYGITYLEQHWKKIDIAQFELTDIPLVQVYVKTAFASTNETAPIDLWTTYDSASKPEYLLFDEGSMYLYYKYFEARQDYFTHEWENRTSYRFDGNYMIVLVK